MASAQMLHTLQCLIDQKSLILSNGSLNSRSHLLPFSNTGSPCQRRRIDRLSPPRASLKFDLSQLMGGRGLCNGEAGLERELTQERKSEEEDATTHAFEPEKEEAGDKKETRILSSFGLKEDAFEKELLGFTGGFPGGEKGLKQFIEKNPPPRKEAGSGKGIPGARPKAPELPILMPGMIVIVTNKDNPFYMYSGIVQRITDGKAGVLFEGGNWDRLITFELGELERREKGPPMVNPKSAVLETMAEQ
ncbi:NAD(P)H-quinone oxidoreductase subunit S, chloroplastic [Nymphaea colorata]|uniref:NAD(P)H-quinone oxidoreductase subunit S, chloroplastic n=1 Tax=Nymphaea colorata TaxID=210225 RepID=A0A5K0X385_9MAGN|nr:NAD(P)H-quinone oxidoreductase subunit S, chloroplastic [Nymphaea colorata]